VPFLTS